jgi:biopolymer transport protein ExbD
MKLTTYPVLAAAFAIGLCADVLAEQKQEYPQISLCGPGGGKNPITRDEYIILVVEGPTISYATNSIPDAQVVDYVNKLLEVKKLSYIAVCSREGTKFGEVVRALDLLRGTKAKNIGLNVKEVPIGREL